MPSPYLQAHIVAMEDGRAFLWAGMADGFERGKHQARAEVEQFAGARAWDSCAYPVDKGLAAGLWELQRKP
jgi:hypothetical protein